jgi:hypothetical protein
MSSISGPQAVPVASPGATAAGLRSCSSQASAISAGAKMRKLLNPRPKAPGENGSGSRLAELDEDGRANSKSRGEKVGVGIF